MENYTHFQLKEKKIVLQFFIFSHLPKLSLLYIFLSNHKNIEKKNFTSIWAFIKNSAEHIQVPQIIYRVSLFKKAHCPTYVYIVEMRTSQ